MNVLVRVSRYAFPSGAAGAPVLVANRLEPAGGAELGQQLAGLMARGRIVLGLSKGREQTRGEIAHALRQCHMRVVEKCADRGGIKHQMNLGSRLERNAS